MEQKSITKNQEPLSPPYSPNLPQYCEGYQVPNPSQNTQLWSIPKPSAPVMRVEDYNQVVQSYIQHNSSAPPVLQVMYNNYNQSHITNQVQQYIPNSYQNLNPNIQYYWLPNSSGTQYYPIPLTHYSYSTRDSKIFT